ncbi:MAG: hypothetical protein QF570_12010 [Myxococcota bacterium]|nr:hypothetical protein [Myxococcota bacterium]
MIVRGRQKSKWLRRAITALVTLAVFDLTACAPEAPPETGPPRWARRIVPFENTWRPESEIPAEPQESPAMVLWELTAFEPGSPPTPEQQAAADALLEDCYRAALEHGWYDFEKGLADGFQLMFEDRRHYENREYILDDRVLDPDRPEFLMYYGTPRGKRLSGFMFYTDEPLARGPQPGGNLMIWHYHVWKQTLCLLDGLVSVGVGDSSGRCKDGTPTHRSPEMLHVWLIDHPEGPFTTSMMLEPRLFRRLVEQRNRERPETRVAGDM